MSSESPLSSNFAYDHQDALKDRHYVKVSVIENDWTRIAKGKLDRYIGRFGEAFTIILITEPEATDGYLVIPYAHIKHCLTAATLENSSDRERSPGWNMFVLDDKLRITNSEDRFPISAFHPERWQGVVDTATGGVTLTAPRVEVGAVYRRADEDHVVADRDPFAVDPVKVDRGNRGHATTQNALADHLREREIEPRSPGPCDPEFDLAWEHDAVVYVAEVKSITDANEEKQLRLGLGQILRYRQQLGAGARQVVAVLVPEKMPTDPTWSGLCRELGVVLMWPPSFDGFLLAPAKT